MKGAGKKQKVSTWKIKFIVLDSLRDYYAKKIKFEFENFF